MKADDIWTFDNFSCPGHEPSTTSQALFWTIGGADATWNERFQAATLASEPKLLRPSTTILISGTRGLGQGIWTAGNL